MKRISFYTILFAITTIALFSFSSIDETFIERLKSKLTEFNQRYPEERVYLQFDKTWYKPGEDIWFKAYLVNGSNLTPSSISTVLYVELVDPRGTVIKKAELFVEEGTTHGDFALDASIAGGLYTMRAFTRWMQNFPEENYFTKEVTVQKVITPRLLLTLDFEKKAYGKNDVVIAQLEARSLKDEPLSEADIKAKLKLGGIEVQSNTFKTDARGKAAISFQLPNDLNITDGLLQLVLSLDGVEESISRSIPIVLNKIRLRFFPEGGDIIAGARVRIGLEAMNEFGKGADVAGIIVDESGQTVSAFESYHMGMGAFELKPEHGHQYSAKITRPQGIAEAYPLPTIKKEGLALSIETRHDTTLIAHVFSSAPTQAFLVGHVHGVVHIAQKLQLPVGWTETRLDTHSVPVGILTFTLFTGDGVEACERLAFIGGQKTLRITMTTNQKEYLPGEKTEVLIKTTTHEGQPVAANLSVAVVDDQLISLADDKQDNMLSWLLMSNELKGKIEEPSFYFNPDEPKARQALDHLLMIRGWRRFTWQQVFTANQPLTYLPENDRDLNGLVLNARGNNQKAEVVLMELNNRKRLAKVRANKNGQFLFRNIDASTPMFLLTRKPNTIEVNGARSTSVLSQNGYYYDSRDERAYWINPVLELNDQVNADTIRSFMPFQGGEVEIDMSADVSQLLEVVVTGYGISREKKALGYSTTTIVNEMPPTLLTNMAIESMLNGRVAGVRISQSGQPGTGANIQIRGISSLSNRAEPLWVIDGVPVSGSLNDNFSVGSQLTPGNISSVSVLKAAEATALFGSRAANGVILVETKTRADHSNFNYVLKKPKYSVLAINPRTYTVAREFYTEASKEKDSRTNFKSTVFWKHTVVTDKHGEAKIQFSNSDAVSTFRITAEGFNGNGLIGRKETTYHTLLPFTLDARMPNYLGFEDTLLIPIRIANNTKTKLSGKLTIQIPKQLRSTSELKRTVEVEPNQTITIPIAIMPTGISGSFPISIDLEGNRHRDNLKQMIDVHPIGFPVRVSYSGKNLNNTITVPIRDVEKGSIQGGLVFVTDVLEDLFTGAEAMLREPHGCFEQVSSSTFPNILALQFLRKTGRSNAAIETKALHLIQQGYKMLKGYEIKSGGFEWFGHPPAHEALTAFGLIEFHEMQKVFSGVDPDMIARTKNWLLNRRKGDGTFLQDRGKYGFSAAPEAVSNAYLVYALSETGVAGIMPEYQHSLQEATATQDMYLAALMANAALNYNQVEDFTILKKMFSKAVANQGLGALKINSSITHSYGNSLTNETMALWALALMKESTPDYKLITDCLEFIGTKKSFGMYGSTQATYLTLKAITAYHTLVQGARSDGAVAVSVNQGNKETQTFTQSMRDNLVFQDLANQLKVGNNTIDFAFQNTTEALPFSLNLTWNTKTPSSNASCKLKIETTLQQKEVKLNETVRFSVLLTNTSDTGVPMSMAVVGIPAGLSLQPWQLKELKEKEVFDFYEIMGDKLVLYYRELGPAQIKEINLDLKADLPGSFLSTASCAYLYYASEYKYWTEGTKLHVMQ